MAGAHSPAPDYDSGYRGLLSNYRTRLFAAILLVVAVVLGLVLFSLPRLLEGFFLDREQAALETRARSMATVIAGELAEVSEDGVRPMILPDGTLGGSTRWTLGDGGRGTVSELLDIAIADAYVALAPAAGQEPVWEVMVAYPEEGGGEGQNREPSLSASATSTVSDLWYSESAPPERELTVTLSNPFTSREQTTQTITEVLLNAALVALVVALITAFILAQWLARPLRRLTVTSRLLAEGHLDARVKVPGNSPPEVRELGHAFNDMAARLEESVHIISQDRDRSREFVADVSHELRTPIAAMRTFNELLLEGAADDPETRDEFLRGSRQQLERLDWLAANLLELSKLDSGLVMLQLRDEDLRTVAEDAVDHAEPMAERKGVELRTHLPDEPIIQPHDPPRLGQVLGNLIGNAIKFTPSGGHVDVSVAASGAGAAFTVKDDGVGIDPDELEHVFDRFYRGTRRREERSGGSGLGLAIARSIVDMHHGRISISSTPDVGTEVLVTLPRDIEASSPADARG
ncbi:MAG: HAMP domain-containing sensor histidine kinase [Chloroflexota bacterium]|jgi:signal transduction histidine kinase